MKRILVPIIVVVVLVVGYGAGQLTAPKASAPVSVISPTIPTRPIEPNMPTGADSAVVTAPQPSPVAAPSVQAWYGPDRNQVGDSIEAGIKKYKEEHQAPPPPPKLQPLNVQ
jgi:hypothetical protein